MRLTWHLGLGRDLGLAFWALTLFEATIGAYSSVWPLWIERLGAPITVVGLVLGSSGLIRPLILMPSSWIFDRFPARRILLASRMISLCGLLVAAVAQEWTLLLITTATNAVGELVFATIHNYVAEYGGENKVRAFSMVATIGPASALIVMPILSGAVIEVFGIRAAFVLAAMCTAGALCFVAKMTFDRPTHADSSDSMPSYRETISHRETRLLLLVHAGTLVFLATGVSLIPNYLEDFRSLSPSLISVLSAGAAVGTVTFTLITARVKRMESHPLYSASIATAFVVVCLLIMAVFSPLPAIAVAYVFRGGVFSAWVLFIAAVGIWTPSRIRSRAFIVLEILGGGAFSFGPVIASLLYNVDARLPLIFGAVGASLMIVIILRLHREIGDPPTKPVLI